MSYHTRKTSLNSPSLDILPPEGAASIQPSFSATAASGWRPASAVARRKKPQKLRKEGEYSGGLLRLDPSPIPQHDGPPPMAQTLPRVSTAPAGDVARAMAKPKPLKREFDLFDKPPSPLTASRPQVTVKPQALGALKGNTLDTDDSKVSWAVSLPSSNAPIGDYYDRLQQMLEQNMTEDDSDSDEEERVSAAVPLGGRKEAGVAGQAASSPSSVGPASSVSSKRSTKSNKPKLEKALARMRSLDEQLSSLEQKEKEISFATRQSESVYDAEGEDAGGIGLRRKRAAVSTKQGAEDAEGGRAKAPAVPRFSVNDVRSRLKMRWKAEGKEDPGHVQRNKELAARGSRLTEAEERRLAELLLDVEGFENTPEALDLLDKEEEQGGPISLEDYQVELSVGLGPQLSRKLAWSEGGLSTPSTITSVEQSQHAGQEAEKKKKQEEEADNAVDKLSQEKLKVEDLDARSTLSSAPASGRPGSAQSAASSKSSLAQETAEWEFKIKSELERQRREALRKRAINRLVLSLEEGFAPEDKDKETLTRIDSSLTEMVASGKASEAASSIGPKLKLLPVFLTALEEQTRLSAVTEGDEKLEEEDEEEDEGSDNSDSDDDTSVAATAEKHGKDIWSGGSAKKSARSGGTKTTRKSRRFGLEAGTKIGDPGFLAGQRAERLQKQRLRAVEAALKALKTLPHTLIGSDGQGAMSGGSPSKSQASLLSARVKAGRDRGTKDTDAGSVVSDTSHWTSISQRTPQSAKTNLTTESIASMARAPSRMDLMVELANAKDAIPKEDVASRDAIESLISQLRAAIPSDVWEMQRAESERLSTARSTRPGGKGLAAQVGFRWRPSKRSNASVPSSSASASGGDETASTGGGPLLRSRKAALEAVAPAVQQKAGSALLAGAVALPAPPSQPSPEAEVAEAEAEAEAPLPPRSPLQGSQGSGGQPAPPPPASKIPKRRPSKQTKRAPSAVEAAPTNPLFANPFDALAPVPRIDAMGRRIGVMGGQAEAARQAKAKKARAAAPVQPSPLETPPSPPSPSGPSSTRSARSPGVLSPSAKKEEPEWEYVPDDEEDYEWDRGLLDKLQAVVSSSTASADQGGEGGGANENESRKAPNVKELMEHVQSQLLASQVDVEDEQAEVEQRAESLDAEAASALINELLSRRGISLERRPLEVEDLAEEKGQLSHSTPAAVPTQEEDEATAAAAAAPKTAESTAEVKGEEDHVDAPHEADSLEEGTETAGKEEEGGSEEEAEDTAATDISARLWMQLQEVQLAMEEFNRDAEEWQEEQQGLNDSRSVWDRFRQQGTSKAQNV